MSHQPPRFELQRAADSATVLRLAGDWVQGHPTIEFAPLCADIAALSPASLVVDGAELGAWDSILMAFLLQSYNYCQRQQIQFSTRALPEAAEQLLHIATAVPAHQRPAQPRASLLQMLNPSAFLHHTTKGIAESLAFFGNLMLALIVMMPLLTVDVDILGILGGGIVAGGMGISFLQYLNPTGGRAQNQPAERTARG